MAKDDITLAWHISIKSWQKDSWTMQFFSGDWGDNSPLWTAELKNEAGVFLLFLLSLYYYNIVIFILIIIYHYYCYYCYH